ncbi:MAG: TIGR03000 domain-containing protein [Gemmataceae bacterium]
MQIHAIRLLVLLSAPTILVLSISPDAHSWGGRKPKIKSYHFGRYTVPPSIYGYKLDEMSPGYYGGGRYNEYYNFGRGYWFADFPGPVPEAAANLLPYRVWPYRDQRWPVVADHTPMDKCACIYVQVPADAEVWLEGQRMQQTGPVRKFHSPPLAPQQSYVYKIRARWKHGTGRLEQLRQVRVVRGENVLVSFPLTGITSPAPLPQFASPVKQWTSEN